MDRLDIQEATLGDLDAAAFAVSDGTGSAWSPSEPFLDRARWLVASEGGTLLARLSYEIAHDLHAAPGATGLIGRYDAANDAAGVALLRAAVQRLAAAGAERVLGPMNGSTWARYRLLVGHGPADGPAQAIELPFPAEPLNPPTYPTQFQAAGFEVVAAYESRIVRDLARPQPRAQARGVELAARGIRVRQLELARFESEIAALHAVSLAAFAGNPWYTAIDATAFRSLYAPLRDRIDPELVLLATDPADALLGFVFAFVDPARAGRPSRVVAKTMATTPAARGLGIGTYLMDRVRAAALERGHGAVIHALMHVANASLEMSRPTTEVFRRYALYGARVTP